MPVYCANLGRAKWGRTTVCRKRGYRPFGESVSTTGSFAYTGQRIDPETSGLYYYRARMYSPKLGRFVQPDPIGYAAGTNLYAYVGNDPVNRWDPTGQIAYVTRTGNNVTIDFPIKFQGNGATPDMVNQLTSAIQAEWSGQKGMYNVTVNVYEPSASMSPSQYNTMTIASGAGVSNVNRIGGNQGTLYTAYPGDGPYSPDISNKVAAHEAGHMMGDDDYYTKSIVNGQRVTNPWQGYENNLMGTISSSATTDFKNVNSVVNFWGGGVSASGTQAPSTGGGGK
jgi:RHS repeat-associated protein